ncbi:hypothetical protein O7626_08595 [Micromonospora sp. WMMD1102]|uniref:hypothetical protein n=1 Tax=Micromonospora sp. WMMD1102 TaxID=3016105 RepID=UPI00241513D9|nr:hypothetical protein [Micromonospora sp. WMMD1102]MDG4785982.1 hypothetical protein [Micromonospora sp. WMMD1102]
MDAQRTVGEFVEATILVGEPAEVPMRTCGEPGRRDPQRERQVVAQGHYRVCGSRFAGRCIRPEHAGQHRQLVPQVGPFNEAPFGPGQTRQPRPAGHQHDGGRISGKQRKDRPFVGGVVEHH